MAFENITLDSSDLIGTLTLNRPEKLNAMSPALIAEFADALTQIESDPKIKVLVIRGAGRAFCTGYDLTVGLSESGAAPIRSTTISARCNATSNTGCACATCPSP